MSDIPDWARDRVYVLRRAEGDCNTPVMDAFARYISEHEQPPVDPIADVLAAVYDYCSAMMLARFHTALVKHGLQITPICSTGATK